MEDFPREVKKSKRDDKSFDSNTNELKSNNFKNRKRNNIRENEKESGEKVNAKKFKAENYFKPFQFHVEQGILVLGCVTEIRDYDIIINLIDGVKGKVSITDIGNSYTDKLHKLASGKSDEASLKLLSLHDIFHLGSVVRCCVTQCEYLSKKTILSLTLDPCIVNKDVVKLKQGHLLSGVVSSFEDHGYLIDIGIKGISAFLPNEETDKFIQYNKEHFPDNVEISIGSYLTCMIDEKHFESKSVVKVAIDPNKISGTFQSTIQLQSLLPGVVVKCVVSSVNDKGLIVKVNSFDGIVFKNHLTKNIKQYEVDQELLLTVLYIQPSTKFIVLSQLKHLQNPNKYDILFENVEIGNVMKDIKISKVEPKTGLYIKLSDKVSGLVKKSQLTDKTESDLSNFKKGQEITCRVIGFNYLENIVQLTMRESIINMAYYNYDDVKPGQVVNCSVKQFYKGSLIVKIMGRIIGCIPAMHVSDIPLLNPEKKFKIGKILKCKVLCIKADGNRLVLSNKKTLVKSKYPVPTNFDDIKKNSWITGFVASIKPQGVLVVFCEDVKGWVPKQELSYLDIDVDISNKFYVGQVVNCKVLSCDPLGKKMILSLKATNSSSDVVKPNLEKIITEDKGNSLNLPKSSLENVLCSENDAAKSMKKIDPPHLVLQVNEKFDWDDKNVFNLKDTFVSDSINKPKLLKVNAKLQLENSENKRLDFERACLLEPNSSLVWLNWLSFEIENGQIDKAREVVQKALNGILYREDKEKTNIWIAYINMEYQFGSEEALKRVISEALKFCDQYKIYCHIRDMYSADKKIDKAVEICKILIEKYKSNPDVWVSYGRVLYKANSLPEARLVLNTSLERLNSHCHIELTTKFALLESKYGIPERAETLLEDIIKKFPKRIDIWSIYVDICIKNDKIEQARNLFLRSTELSLPVKKMKALYKKFINFEEKYGTVDELENVKQKASKYLAGDLN